MKILLITPPLLQPNTPYAATPLLTAWLKSIGHDAVQADFSLELLLRLFSKEGISTLAKELDWPDQKAESYRDPVEEVVSFLQDRNPHIAEKLVQRDYLPEGTNLGHAYELEEQLGWNFRGLETHDRARHLSSLYLDDIADAASALDPNFGFSRYAEKLSVSLTSFIPLREELESGQSLFRSWLDEITEVALVKHQPEMVVLTVPFPGCLLGALAVAKFIKTNQPNVHVTLGGGYVSTELRELKEPDIFNYVDSVTLDSGFLPLQQLLNGGGLVRTHVLENGVVKYRNKQQPEIPHNQLPPPDYTGLDLSKYFGLFEQLNPVTRLWSDGRWNKLVLAHGCYWQRCAFCDTSIDYICRYDSADPKTICNWIADAMQQTGFNGFHFADEALPPDLLDDLCDEILCRGLQVEWWGNIRFEKKFSAALLQKMADSGCIAITGGLETCCDRTLKLMRKGITVEQAKRILSDASEAGMMTHVYLMYGFPTQTQHETFHALDIVRRLFENNILHSAYWHRFALTNHSDMCKHPENYSIRAIPPGDSSFALNEVPFTAEFDHDVEAIGQALANATYNYQLGMGFDITPSEWLQ